ncbi:MAPEG family protein [Lysobacter sp. A03]|uniref:MAPEG family protein n=1 Tax=Lysobacter sp. A03 TaxID=1199154 RepID=UPI0005C6002A|nr:MAPEG family protein [Lysobacter sp. A03]
MTLSTAYWCVLVVAMLPYVWTVVAKLSGKGRFDNNDPRAWLARQDNPRTSRANSAQMNAFEAFPAFAAAVILAQLAGVEHPRIALLALIFVVARILHGIFYVTDKASLRTGTWFIGLVCVVALLVQAAMHVASPV